MRIPAPRPMAAVTPTFGTGVTVLLGVNNLLIDDSQQLEARLWCDVDVDDKRPFVTAAVRIRASVAHEGKFALNAGVPLSGADALFALRRLTHVTLHKRVARVLRELFGVTLLCSCAHVRNSVEAAKRGCVMTVSKPDEHGVVCARSPCRLTVAR